MCDPLRRQISVLDERNNELSRDNHDLTRSARIYEKVIKEQKQINEKLVADLSKMRGIANESNQKARSAEIVLASRQRELERRFSDYEKKNTQK